MEHHAVAGFDVRLGEVGFLDDSGTVDAHDLGQGVGDVGAAVAHVEFHAVERGAFHAYQDLTWPTDGIWPLAEDHGIP